MYCRRSQARDRKYVDTFRREQNGKAELHALELDFGKAGGAG